MKKVSREGMESENGNWGCELRTNKLFDWTTQGVGSEAVTFLHHSSSCSFQNVKRYEMFVVLSSDLISWEGKSCQVSRRMEKRSEVGWGVEGFFWAAQFVRILFIQLSSSSLGINFLCHLSFSLSLPPLHPPLTHFLFFPHFSCPIQWLVLRWNQ